MRNLFVVLDDVEDTLNECREVIRNQSEELSAAQFHIQKQDAIIETQDKLVVMQDKIIANLEGTKALQKVMLKKADDRIEKMKALLDRRLETIIEQEAQLKVKTTPEPQPVKKIPDPQPNLQHHVYLVYFDQKKDYVTFKKQDGGLANVSYRSYCMALREETVDDIYKVIHGRNWLSAETSRNVTEWIAKFRYDLTDWEPLPAPE